MLRFLALLLALVAEATAARAADYAVISTIPGPDGRWDYVSIDTAARRLYIAHGDAVTVLDLASGKLNPKLTDGQGLHAVVPLPGGRVLSTNGRSNTARVFEAATGAAIADVPTGEGPDAAAFDRSTDLAAVMNGHSGDITLIDPAAGKAVATVAVGGKLEFAAADGKGRIYVNIEDRNEIAVLDVAARQVTARIPLPDCDGPGGLAIDPLRGLLVTACDNQKALAVDTATAKVVATLPIGKGPDAVLFDSERRRFFVPCGRDGTLVVIAENDAAAPTIIATVPTAVGARTGAVDPVTGRVYLVTADFTPPPPGEKRPVAVPGTFRILVVGTP